MAQLTDPMTIDLDAIDFEDKTFVISFGRSFETLARAIELAGLLNPPILARKPGEDAYRIVCGFLRLLAQRQLGYKKMQVRLLEPDYQDLQLLELSICDNMSHRSLNSIEQAGAVKRLLQHIPEAEVIERWLPLLGLKPSAKALEACLRIDGLEHTIKMALAAGTIAGRSAIELAGLAATDRLALYRLFMVVHLSASKQAEIIETCKDLALRDGTDIPAIIGSPEIAAVLADPNPDLSCKGEQVRQFLRRCRYPRLTRKEEQFCSLAKKLPRLGGVRLLPPQSFEGDTYRLEISFSQPESLADAAETIQKLARDERLRTLFGDGR